MGKLEVYETVPSPFTPDEPHAGTIRTRQVNALDLYVGCRGPCQPATVEVHPCFEPHIDDSVITLDLDFDARYCIIRVCTPLRECPRAVVVIGGPDCGVST